MVGVWGVDAPELRWRLRSNGGRRLRLLCLDSLREGEGGGAGRVAWRAAKSFRRIKRMSCLAFLPDQIFGPNVRATVPHGKVTVLYVQ